MRALLGADTRHVDVIAELLRGHSRDVQDLRSMAQRAVAETRSAWAGPDFESMAQRWEQEAGPCLTDVSTLLGRMAGALLSQAEEQRQASEGGAPSGGGGQQRRAEGRGRGEADLRRAVSESRYGDGSWTDTRSSTIYRHEAGGSLRVDVMGRGAGEPSPGDRARNNVKLNLAGARVGVDASLTTLKGGNDNGSFELSTAKVEANGLYSVDVNVHGDIVASADVLAGAYAGYAAGRAGGGSGFANGTVGGKAYVGAETKASAAASIGPDGAQGHLGAEALAGAEAVVDAGATVAGVTAGAGAEISFGIGARAEVDAALSATSVGVSVDIGATLGIGAGIKLEVSVNPQAVIAIVGDVVGGIGEAAEGIGDQAASAADEVASLGHW